MGRANNHSILPPMGQSVPMLTCSSAGRSARGVRHHPRTPGADPLIDPTPAATPVRGEAVENGRAARDIPGVTTEVLILILVIGTALAFDFTNGFHDTANAMATSIATGALKPKIAVLLAGGLNLVGAFISVAVATTVAKGTPSRRLLRTHWRHHREPADLVVRSPLQFLPRPVRRPHRRRDRGARCLRGRVGRRPAEDRRAGTGRPADRRHHRRARHRGCLLADQEDP